jgi:uncharacterized metal-binding protein
METIEFATSLVSGDDRPDDRRIVIALFSISGCAAILKCSEDAALALIREIGSELMCLA